MKTKSHSSRSGLTLLELVIVLAILAVVTLVATREVGHVQDQQRFDASQAGLDALEAAVLGWAGDRLPDLPAAAPGFVADMGRLPRTVGSTNLTLAELWANPGVPFDVRAAVPSNGVALLDADPQVLVPGGWRGPYLRLPPGADNLLDGWGNPYASPEDPLPPDPDEAGYARLRDAFDQPIVTTGREVRVVRHLGANGRRDDTDTGYDTDRALVFSDATVRAGLKGQVEVLNGSSPATPDPFDTVTVRAFGPDPDDASRIRVWTNTVLFLTNPVFWEIPLADGMIVGPRVVRAYFRDLNGSGTTANSRSAVRHVALRGGVNHVNLTIDR